MMIEFLSGQGAQAVLVVVACWVALASLLPLLASAQQVFVIGQDTNLIVNPGAEQNVPNGGPVYKNRPKDLITGWDYSCASCFPRLVSVFDTFFSHSFF